MSGEESAVLEAPADALREAGLRATRQRLTVLDSLRGREGSVTAQDLHAELRAAGEPVGLTTVYRTLSALAEAGMLDTFSRESEQAFRLCGDAHHHHLVCETCNKVEEIVADSVEAWVADIGQRHQFQVTGHRADVFGVCRECQVE